MNRWAISALLVGMGLTPASHATAQIDDVADQRVIRVMTRNVDHGVDAEIFGVPEWWPSDHAGVAAALAIPLQ